MRERRDPDGGVGVAEIGVADALDGAEGRKIVGIQVEVVDADAETVLLAGLAEITVCQGRQIVDAGVGDVDPAQLAEILNPPDRVDLRALEVEEAQALQREDSGRILERRAELGV